MSRCHFSVSLEICGLYFVVFSLFSIHYILLKLLGWCFVREGAYARNREKSKKFKGGGNASRYALCSSEEIMTRAVYLVLIVVVVISLGWLETETETKTIRAQLMFHGPRPYPLFPEPYCKSILQCNSTRIFTLFFKTKLIVIRHFQLLTLKINHFYYFPLGKSQVFFIQGSIFL